MNPFTAPRPMVRAEALEPRRLLAAIASGQTIAGSLAIGQTEDFTFSASAGVMTIRRLVGGGVGTGVGATTALNASVLLKTSAQFNGSGPPAT